MRVIIFDTETIGKVSQDLINIGYKIIDIDIQKNYYETLCERDYLVTNLINNVVYCINDDFVGTEKYKKFLYAIETKTAIKRSVKQIFTTMKNDIKKYGVLFGYAYNCDFDIDKFEKTSLKMGLENPLKDLKIFDIWAYAYQYICATEEYQSWCKLFEVYTPSELYLPTSVEGVCKYLYEIPSFEEEHTALSDVQHETFILMECVKRGCDITRNLPKAKKIKSDKVFNKTIVLPNGQELEIEYKGVYEKNNKITYK